MDLTNIKKGNFIKYKGESNVYYTKNKEYEVIDDGVTSIYILTNPGYPTHLNTIDDLSVWGAASRLNSIDGNSDIIRAAIKKTFSVEDKQIRVEKTEEVTKCADIDFEELANNMSKPMNNKDIVNLLGRE